MIRIFGCWTLMFTLRIFIKPTLISRLVHKYSIFQLKNKTSKQLNELPKVLGVPQSDFPLWPLRSLDKYYTSRDSHPPSWWIKDGINKEGGDSASYIRVTREIMQTATRKTWLYIFWLFLSEIMLACCFLLQIKTKERSLHVASDSQCPEEIRYDWVSAFCVISDPGRELRSSLKQ